MENFLLISTRTDGSVGEFLASRKADTPEQLGHLLQQQTGTGKQPPPRKPKNRLL